MSVRIESRWIEGHIYDCIYLSVDVDEESVEDKTFGKNLRQR